MRGDDDPQFMLGGVAFGVFHVNCKRVSALHNRLCEVRIVLSDKRDGIPLANLVRAQRYRPA